MTPTSTPAIARTFAELALDASLLAALAQKNYIEPTPIQAQCIPHLLEGRDIIGCAQTGTGKTAAFALPLLQRLTAMPKPRVPRKPRALILAPTRELAMQIDQSFADYGRNLKINHTVIFGGVSSMHQIRALSRGVDVLVATPGRLADLERQRHVSLDSVEFFVLDEADRMLDQGFIHEIKRVVAKLPPKRQSLLFSATMPREIEDLAASIVNKPVRVSVVPQATTAERIEQKVCFVDNANKLNLLVHLLKEHTEGLVLVFVRMKHQANRLVEQLDKNGIKAEAIHGNKSQGARQRALENFRSGRSRIMVATDIAARGIDVKGIALVVNFNLPEEPESYVHRIGRTARAGHEGQAVSLCDRTEIGLLRSIERIIRQAIPVQRDHPFAATSAREDIQEVQTGAPRSRFGRSSRPGQGRGNGGNRSHQGGGFHRGGHSRFGSRRPRAAASV